MRFWEKLRGKNIYIVIPSYSRVIRTIIRTRIARDECFKDIKVVICVDGDTEHDFGSKLMYQQIINEHYGCDSNISTRTWRSTAEAFLSRFDEETDYLVVCNGCDRIESKENNIAYLKESMSWLENLRKSEDHIIDVLIIAENYKYDLDILTSKINDSVLNTKVSNLLPKPRRAGLYQWKSDKECMKYRVEVISTALPNQ